MSKILLMTDSGSDISSKTAAEYNIKVIPLKYSFDGENYYYDGVDQTMEEFYEMEKRSDSVPKTSQISPLEFEEAFVKAYKDGYDTVIYTALSAKASGTCQNAMMVAGDLMDQYEGFRIEVIDSEKFSALYGFAVIAGAKLLEEGKDADEIISGIKKVCEGSSAFFLTEDLVHLKKGGRINAATFAVANLLDIKPVLVIRDGLVEQGAKLRGTKNLYKKLVDTASAACDLNRGSVYTIHTCMPEKAEDLREAIKAQFPEIEVGDTFVGPTIGCHSGPALFGIVHFDEKI